jgi:hypothetical protein
MVPNGLTDVPHNTIDDVSVTDYKLYLPPY